MKPIAVVFDLFDTLVIRDETLYLNAKVEMARLVEVPPDRFLTEWRSHAEDSVAGRIDTEERFRLTLRGLGRPARWSLVRRLVELEEAEQESATTVPGATEVLQTLHDLGFKLGLVSNLSFAARRVIDIAGLRRFFGAVVFSFEEGVVKPDPQIFILLASRLNVPIRECIFVGDGNDYELDGAHAAGMATILVSQGKNVLLRNGESTYCDRLVYRLTELPAAIAQLSSKPS